MYRITLADTFAKKYDMAIENIGQLKHISGALLAGKKVNVFTNKNAENLSKSLEVKKRRMIFFSLIFSSI